MNVQPTRPARAVKPKHDENAVPTVKATTLKAVAAKENAAGKGEVKRKAFGDVSNVAKQVTAATKSSGLTEKANKIVLKEKDQVAVKNALAKPAQRGPVRNTGSTSQATTNTTSTVAKTSMPGPARRAVKKTEVYADKRPSPQKSTNVKALSPKKVKKSPKSKAGNAIQRESRKVRGQSGSGQVTLKNSRIDFSNKLALSHINDEPEAGAEETDEDATDVEDDELNAQAESEEEDFDEDDEDYTTARSKSAGDNTTGVTAPILAPRVTASDKKELLEASQEFQEIDEDDMFDITMVAEYGDEIFEYMRELEAKLLPPANYMQMVQPDIQWSMRAILVDWIVQVHNRFQLLPETLFLAINYIDRFLAQKIVSINKLQLVGATALFIAAKYEEILCPSVHEIVFMVDNGYTIDEILAAERFMLSQLKFELGYPGPMSFLRRVSKADDYDLETRTLAKYFLEFTIMDERFVGTPPSFLAAGAHYLARSMLGRGDWTPGHAHFSGYTANQLRPVVKLMVECCADPITHHKAIFEKYQDKRRYRSASLYVQKFLKAKAPLPCLD